jgi:methionyl aminopeptidase
MTIETEEDLAGMRKVSRVVALARDTMAGHVAPGVTPRELDQIGRKVLEAHGARSAPELVYSFPAATCISVNDCIAHGIPSDRRLAEGDLVNIDVSAELGGYFGDTGASFPVGRVAPKMTELLSSTREALNDAMSEARAGRPIRNVGRAVERRARNSGFEVIRTLCGHGVGRHIHEQPDISNTFDPRRKGTFWEGLVFTIEPFLTTGARTVYEDEDGWSLRTPDGSWGAQFEHTLVITRGEPLVLT